MRVLANENVSSTVVRGLRASGHDVLAVKESLPGADDETVLRRAQTEERVLITHDKDFGELAYRTRIPAGCGIVLLRVSGPDPDADNERVLAALEGREDWAGHFSVVTDDRVRMRPLPGPVGR
jgi:predicted nuclease of predicted toxin-antitoxin system